MTREALKKLNEKQMNYCKTLSALIDRAKIKGLKEENERNRGKLRGLRCRFLAAYAPLCQCLQLFNTLYCFFVHVLPSLL